jgi:chemotaxis signal transduction protein
MKTREELAQRLAGLRQEFDASFARPAIQAEPPREVLLRLRVGGSLLGVRLSQLAGLHELPRMVALPGSPPGLLGVVGLRGQLVAVHELATRLGLPAEAQRPRWLLLCAADHRLGLAVGGFEGQLRVDPGQLRPRPPDAAPSYLDTLLPAPGQPPLPVLDMALLVKDLLQGAQAPGSAG